MNTLQVLYEQLQPAMTDADFLFFVVHYKIIYVPSQLLLDNR
jgi:hypothetical protein